MKWLKSLIRRRNPKSIIVDELNLAEVYLVQAKLHLDDLNAECKKQEVTVKKYKDRIARLKIDLKEIINESQGAV